MSAQGAAKSRCGRCHCRRSRLRHWCCRRRHRGRSQTCWSRRTPPSPRREAGAPRGREGERCATWPVWVCDEAHPCLFGIAYRETDTGTQNTQRLNCGTRKLRTDPKDTHSPGQSVGQLLVATGQLPVQHRGDSVDEALRRARGSEDGRVGGLDRILGQGSPLARAALSARRRSQSKRAVTAA
jgi:hypothetical protein